jgi:hypothetical protein
MMLSRSIAVVATCTMLSSGALAQSAKAVVGATPWETTENEPPAKLIVDPPLAEPLSRGAAVIQYRTENFRIVPEVGNTAVGVSPRIGHLHVTVDDLPWHWADAGTSNTIIVVGLPAGQHKITIELADPTHRVLTGQTVSFIVPGAGAHAH